MAHFEGRPLERLWDLPYIHPVCLNLVRVSEGKREILLHGDIGHFPEEWRGNRWNRVSSRRQTVPKSGLGLPIKDRECFFRQGILFQA